jgi:hypothetical protein
MKKRPTLALLVALLIALGAYWLLPSSLSPVPQSETQAPSAVSSEAPPGSTVSNPGAEKRGSAPSPMAAAAATGSSRLAPPPNQPLPVPAALAPSNGAAISHEKAMIELDKIHRMIRDFHTLMGQNPVGTNAEIMAAVMGKNPKQATLGPPEGQQLNAKKELIDPWGTPYFFHQLSGDVMEIHSAGPDRIFGTADDLTLQ